MYVTLREERNLGGHVCACVCLCMTERKERDQAKMTPYMRAGLFLEHRTLHWNMYLNLEEKTFKEAS